MKKYQLHHYAYQFIRLEVYLLTNNFYQLCSWHIDLYHFNQQIYDFILYILHLTKNLRYDKLKCIVFYNLFIIFHIKNNNSKIVV